MGIDYKSKEYALYRLRNRLHFLESTSPIMWEAINEDGSFHCSFFDKSLIDDYKSKGYVVGQADIKLEIDYLKTRIAELATRED